jgi:UDP-N-acetylglucosamine/UDP-N-acetylgalactosamine 4-epimerase
MSAYSKLEEELRKNKKRWFVTGVAGFIAGHILERLLNLDQEVVAIDNFSTGSKKNLMEIAGAVGKQRWSRLNFVEGDIQKPGIFNGLLDGADYVIHQAALGSVPRSIDRPTATFDSNINGFINLLEAARAAKVSRVVYASSSSVYGDSPDLPKVETKVGSVLSPYAASKKTNEVIADAYGRVYPMQMVGLRYFNVFGPRQNPNGPYAAVIPKWVDSAFAGEKIIINGDGETSRDFSYIENVIRANLLAATAKITSPVSVYNIACGDRTTLNQLASAIQIHVRDNGGPSRLTLEYVPERAGDVRHSLADISKAKNEIGYEVIVEAAEGIRKTVEWTASRKKAGKKAA